MSEQQKSPAIDKLEQKELRRSYTVGFVLSLVLTFVAYWLVMGAHFTGQITTTIIIGLALCQFFVQLYFFLHLGKEARPRWNLLIFGFMTLIVLILVVGSLWIMHHLDYHGMTPQQTETYIIHDEGIK